jgi:cystathionine gamma-synthase
MSSQLRLETLAVHAGRNIDQASGAVAAAIVPSVTFQRDAEVHYPQGYFYSSKGNPNRNSLEAAFAALESGVTAVAFASGCAAITAVLRTLRPGDHVLVPDDVFQGTIRILREILPKWQISYSSADMTDVDAVRAAIRQNTRLVWLETLSNPMLKVTDVASISKLAHESGAVAVVDNTFVTPVFQHPLQLGADLVVHASTKYIGGHGDVLGVVVARESNSTTETIRQTQLLEGGVPSPFDCWLVHRGFQTLTSRMRGHAQNALHVATALEKEPLITAVYYPGLASHPQFELSRRQLQGGFGRIVSVRVRGGASVASAVCAKVRVFTHATGFGMTESLIQQQTASPTHGLGTNVPEDLLRLSIGLEHPDDLVDDLVTALESAYRDFGAGA